MGENNFGEIAASEKNATTSQFTMCKCSIGKPSAVAVYHICTAEVATRKWLAQNTSPDIIYYDMRGARLDQTV